MKTKLKIGICSCLLGENVRYNGENKRDDFLADILGKEIEYFSFCPEKEMGLAVPREPMRLIEKEEFDFPRLIARETGTDYTGQMQDWIHNNLSRLEMEQICGYIFKSKSPSCGIRDIPVFDEKGKIIRTGMGLFSQAVKEQFKGLPVVDENGMKNENIRNEFLEQALQYGETR